MLEDETDDHQTGAVEPRGPATGLPRTLVLAGESPLPPRSGLRLRVLHLARELTRSCEVDLAVLGAVEPAPDEPFALGSVPHRNRSRALTALHAWRTPYVVAKQRSTAMAALASTPRWDTVQVEFPSLVPAARGATAPVVLDAHNVESDLLGSVADQSPTGPYRLRLRWEAEKMRRFEQRVATEIAAVCTTSDADAEVFERWGAAEVVVVPNGVDTEAVTHRPPPAGARLLYVGHLGYEPNAAAARELVEKVLPLVRAEIGDAHVRLVGRGEERLTTLEGPGVELAGEVPDVLPELRRARAVVLPLRAGSGTRLKVLEAMAAGVPVVATSLAVAGIAVRDGEHVLLGATARELAVQVVRVCLDDALASALSANARALAERTYDWSIVGEPLRELHERLAARGSVPPS